MEVATDEPVSADGAWEDLREARAQALEHEDRSQHFREAVLGGAWNIERSGRALFGIRVDVMTNSVVHPFVKKFGLSLSASFEARVYGERDGHLLSVLWQKRVMGLYEFWVAHGKPDVYPTGLADSVLTGDEVGLPDRLKGRALKRLNAILQLLPS